MIAESRQLVSIYGHSAQWLYPFAMHTHRSLVAVLAVAGAALSAHRTDVAAELALDFKKAFDRAPIANSNYGWSFTLAAPIMVDGLGLWDAGSDGLLEAHDVGLWRTSGPIGVPVLLASGTVSTIDSIPVPSASPDGRWLFRSISSITLEPGSYIVGAFYRTGPTGSYDPFVSDATTMDLAPGVTYGLTRENHNAMSLACPQDFGLNEHNGFFGPNFRIVPEPGATLLIAAGGVLLLRRRRTA
jgi:hypothetical protein